MLAFMGISDVETVLAGGSFAATLRLATRVVEEERLALPRALGVRGEPHERIGHVAVGRAAVLDIALGGLRPQRTARGRLPRSSPS